MNRVLGEFYKKKGEGVFLFLTNKFQNFHYEKVVFDVPQCTLHKIIGNDTEDIIGYKLKCGRNSKVLPKSIMVGSSINSDHLWVPYVALPGLQVFTSEQATAILSCSLSDYSRIISPSLFS